MYSKLNTAAMATLVAIAAFNLSAAPRESKSKKAAVTAGVKTPGVQIPYSSLKADADIALDSPPTGIYFNDAAWIADASGLHKIDAKSNKPPDPAVIVPMSKACGGIVSGFGHAWTLACGDGVLTKVDIPSPPPGRGGFGRPPGEKPPPERLAADDKPAAEKPAAAPPAKPAAPPKIAATIGGMKPIAAVAAAASSDSIWILADDKTTLLRIDPKENQVVADLRLPSGCTGLLYAETAIWVACPAEPKLLRIDAGTNLVDKRIEVPAEPVALAAGEGSIWVLCRKEGKIARIDPKANKVSATIELSVPNASGTMAFGEGSLWVSLPGFPLTRISPTAEKERVLQQFTGPGGGLVLFGLNSLWLGSADSKTVTRLDPKRVAATLAE